MDKIIKLTISEIGLLGILIILATWYIHKLLDKLTDRHFKKIETCDEMSLRSKENERNEGIKLAHILLYEATLCKNDLKDLINFPNNINGTKLHNSFNNFSKTFNRNQLKFSENRFYIIHRYKRRLESIVIEANHDLSNNSFADEEKVSYYKHMLTEIENKLVDIRETLREFIEEIKTNKH